MNREKGTCCTGEKRKKTASKIWHTHIRSGASRDTLAASFDCFLALLAIIFFAFGALTRHTNYTLVEDVPYADALLSAVHLVSAPQSFTICPIARVLTLRQGPTSFPMIFALIAVRLINPMHRASASGDKKRNNTQVRVLQQLLDSRTIGDTLATLAKLRAVIITVLLLVLL